MQVYCNIDHTTYLHNLFWFVLYLELQPWEAFKIYACSLMVLRLSICMAEVAGLLVMKIENVNGSLSLPVST